MKKYVLYRKRKLASLRYLIDGAACISLIMQKLYIDKWRIALIRLTQERQKLCRAEEHWSARVLKNYFFVWKIFSESHKSRARLKSELNEIGKSVLLNTYLTRWRTKYAAVEAINEKGRHAAAVYSKKIKLRLFKSWMSYTEAKSRRKIESDNVIENPKIFTSRLRSARNNCAEDLRILRKCFDGWSAFFRKKKDKTIMGCCARNVNRRAYLSPHSTWLVLPEYMRKKTIYSRDNCGFSEDNWRNDNVEFSEFARRYLPLLSSRSPSEDRATSDGDTSNDSSDATYSVRSPIYARNELRNISR